MIAHQDSWVNSANRGDYSIANLPYGVFRDRGDVGVGVAIGDEILDLSAVMALGYFEGLARELPALAGQEIFAASSLNRFIAGGPTVWRAVRSRIQELLSARNNEMAKFASQVFRKRATTELLLPVEVGDYTDFYSSIQHATNVGKLFRPDNPLLPNWRHLPIGYHGRASSIVVSGTEITRPSGQVLPPGAEVPVFQRTNALDIELELAFIVGATTALGETIPVASAEEAIFGVALFNDWTARDIQKWEYVPLGPFLGKNFASSMASWITPMDALEPFRVAGPMQEPPPLPYLRTTGRHHFDIELSVTLEGVEGESVTMCRTNARHLYWSMAQQLAHHTSNGCNVRVGDVMASGTISGDKAGSWGSLLEATFGGKTPIQGPAGRDRRFLEDGDTVTIRGWAERGDVRIGLGEVVGRIRGGHKDDGTAGR